MTFFRMEAISAFVTTEPFERHTLPSAVIIMALRADEETPLPQLVTRFGVTDVPNAFRTRRTNMFAIR